MVCCWKLSTNDEDFLTHSCHWSFSVSPEIIRTPSDFFLIFSGGIERNQWYEMD